MVRPRVDLAAVWFELPLIRPLLAPRPSTDNAVVLAILGALPVSARPARTATHVSTSSSFSRTTHSSNKYLILKLHLIDYSQCL